MAADRSMCNEKDEVDDQGARRFLLLFGPKFREFGVDLSHELVRRGICGCVDGICTGGNKVSRTVRERLGDISGAISDIGAEERKWLREPVDRAALAALENELGSGIVGRILTSDRRVGRGFVVGGASRPDFLADAASRAPLEGPARYVGGLYLFLTAWLAQRRPDAVFAYAVAGAPAVLLGLLCASRGIPFLRLSHSRVENRFVIDDDLQGRLNPVKRAMDADIGFRSASGSDARWAVKHLAQFRKHPKEPEYRSFSAAKDGPTKVAKHAVRATRLSLLAVRGRAHRLRAHRAWIQLVQDVKRLTATERWFTKRVPHTFSWIYFPLHVEPEASTMVLAPWHTNQLAVIEALAKGLPANAILVVKEHAPMLGRRPRGFYRAIAAMPRVALVGPENAGLWWIERSDAVAVITGTAAWEAVRLGKPVLVVGDSPFLKIGEGMTHENCLSSVGDGLRRAMQQPPASDEALGKFLAAVRRSSFGMRTSLLWGNYHRHSASERSTAIDSICDGVAARLAELSHGDVRGADGRGSQQLLTHLDRC